MIDRDVDVAHRILRGVGMALAHANAVDLRADDGAVRDVEVLERRRRRVAAEPAVTLQEVVGELPSIEELQIHCQEGGVVDDVQMAQGIVELEAVQDLHLAVRQAEDVVCEQVAMAVDDASILDARGEKNRPPCDELRGQVFEVTNLVGGQHAADEPFQLGDVLLPQCADGTDLALLVDGATTIGSLVEPRELIGDSLQRRGDRLAVAHPGGQPAGLGVAAHHHDRLGGAAGWVAHVCDAQIRVGGEPAVELDLALARPLAALGSGMVEKVGGDRLLAFVCPVADEYHHPGVGFADLRIGGSCARRRGRRRAGAHGLPHESYSRTTSGSGHSGGGAGDQGLWYTVQLFLGSEVDGRP